MKAKTKFSRNIMVSAVAMGLGLVTAMPISAQMAGSGINPPTAPGSTVVRPMSPYMQQGMMPGQRMQMHNQRRQQYMQDMDPQQHWQHMQAMQNMTPQQRREYMQQRHQQFMQDDLLGMAMTPGLTDEQRNKLQQLDNQMRKIQWEMMSSIAKQREEIQKIMSQNRNSMQQGREQARTHMEQMQKLRDKMQELQEATMKRAREVMDQRQEIMDKAREDRAASAAAPAPETTSTDAGMGPGRMGRGMGPGMMGRRMGPGSGMGMGSGSGMGSGTDTGSRPMGPYGSPWMMPPAGDDSTQQGTAAGTQ